MRRFLTYLIGPECIVCLVMMAVFWFCAHHGSGEGEDLRWMGHLVWAVPLVTVTASFSTILVPGSRQWWWLGRTILVSAIGTGILTARIVEGFGTGAKGQDAAFVIAMMSAGCAMSVCTAASMSMILAARQPAFAAWFRSRPVLGGILTLLAAGPIGIAVFVSMTVVMGFGLGVWSAFSR